MTTADLDGDGSLDVVVGKGQRDELSVLRNLGDGTFAPEVLYASGPSGQVDLEACDLDGDGDLDLAAIRGLVKLLFNDHERTLLSPLKLPANSPAGMQATNLDADEDFELVYANRDSDTVSVIDQEEDGSFAPAATYGTGSLPLYVVASDLDGDGDQDLGVANSGSSNASALMNQGDGTFAPHLEYGAGYQPRELAAGDLDGEGAVDLVVANQRNIAVLLNAGSGAFAPMKEYAAGSQPVFVTLGDLDRDGDLDCAVNVTNPGTNTGAFSVLLGNGNGTYNTPVYHGTGGSGVVALGDLDTDGDLDVVTSGGFSKVFHNMGAATFDSGVTLPLPLAGEMIRIADLNGDGDLDLCGFLTLVAVLENAGDGSFDSPVEFYGAQNNRDTLAVGHLDGDRDLEIVCAATPAPASIWVLWNQSRRKPRTVDPVHDTVVTDPLR